MEVHCVRKWQVCVYTAELEESSCENLTKEIQTNIAFERFSSDDELVKVTEENVGYEPDLKYYEQQKTTV